MNEGCATYCHYRIMNRLYETGQISEGSFLEFLHSHTNVVTQPTYDDRPLQRINPYALGFAMMQDIERIVTVPTEEDREWFPDIAGVGEPFERPEARLGQLSRRELHLAVPQPAS